ncbi:Uncharacterized protein DAT39_011299, partial [Clarias magur]
GRAEVTEILQTVPESCPVPLVLSFTEVSLFLCLCSWYMQDMCIFSERKPMN